MDGVVEGCRGADTPRRPVFWVVQKYLGRGLACAGGGRGAVAAQGLGAVGGAGFGGAVGVQGQGPAEPVHADVMVVGAEQQEVFEPGLAAAGAEHQMVHVTARRGLVAAAGLLITHKRYAAEIGCE